MKRNNSESRSIIVRVVNDWSYPNLLRQTPAGKGVWNGITFTLDDQIECDYLIRYIYPQQETLVRCPPEHVWSLLGEPPNRWAEKLHLDHGDSFRIFTTSTKLSGEKYEHTHPALPWHVDKTYDELLDCSVPDKPKQLSWITSNLQVFDGHRKRMRFLEHIRGKLQFDLYGRGFVPIGDKWDALAPYRYSLAIENHVNDYYWSEKIADCFLAWTMPIYYGCRRISDYFPEDAMVRIDINDPEAMAKIHAAIAGDRWSRGREAIAYARELVLKKYQFFPFISAQIRQFESCHGIFSKRESIRILPRQMPGRIAMLSQHLRDLIARR